MSSSIKIIAKPEWVSWDNIHEVIYLSHANNRANGINMRKPSLPGSEIQKEVGNDGIMLLAMDGNNVVGTSALLFKHKNSWYCQGTYGYMCYASVLPDYNGKGIYRLLCRERETIAKQKGLKYLLFDTHHNNSHVIEINTANGFKRVDIKEMPDHWNVVMFKWLDGCPYSDAYCNFIYLLIYWKVMLKRFVKALLGRI